MQTEKKPAMTQQSKRAAQQLDKQLYSEYLSFQYDKEDDEDYSSSYRPKIRSKRYTRQQIQQRKGLYMRAKFRFITTQEHLSDIATISNTTGASLSWEKITQVIFPCVPGEVACPICMNDQFEIVAPQITPCGHIYCWTCYLRHQDISMTKDFCPLCGEFAPDTELKSAKIQLRNSESADALTEFQLLLKQDGEPTLYNAESQVEDPRFSKVAVAKYDFVLTQILAAEQQSLNEYLAACISSQEVWDIPYIEEALKQNEKKMDKIRKLNAAYEETRKQEESKRKVKKQLALKQAKEGLSSQTENDKNYILKKYNPTSSTASSNTNPNKKSDLTYFYQEQSGSLIFLNPINMKHLMRELKPSELPFTITAKVQNTTNVCFDENLKRRTPYLRHIPEFSDITFAEISMEGLISEAELEKNNQELAVIHKKLKDKEERENKRMQAASRKDSNNPYGEFFDREYYIQNGLIPMTPQTLPTEERHYPQLMSEASTTPAATSKMNENGDTKSSESNLFKVDEDDDYVIMSQNGKLPANYYTKSQRVNEQSFPTLGGPANSTNSKGEVGNIPSPQLVAMESTGSWEEVRESGFDELKKKSVSAIVDLGNNVIVDGDQIYDEWNQSALLLKAKSLSTTSNSNQSASNQSKKKGKKVPLPGNFFY